MSAIDAPARERPAVGADPGATELDARLARIESALDRLLDDAAARDRAMEPLRDLAAEAGVIAGPAFERLTEAVADLDRRGYLTFARGAGTIVDRVVTSFDEQDVRALGDNIVLILETLKDLTQPEVMLLLQRTASAAQEVGHSDALATPPGAFALLRSMRDPEVRRGLARMLELVRTIGASEVPGPTTTGAPATGRRDAQEA